MSKSAELLAQVEKSPAAVAIHDKQAWMSIFGQYHIVEDPVGSTPHVSGIFDARSGQRGNGPLSRFYDTFIAPNKIAFDVQRDVVCGNHVIRDLTINLQMSDSVDASVPMHLLYELAQENGEWKIIRLGAHWEIVPMVKQLLGKGLTAMPVLSALTVRMLKLQGIGGALGFAKAALNIGSAGKKAVQTFEQGFNDKSLSTVMSVFDSDNEIVEMPMGAGKVCPSRVLDNKAEGIKFTKLLASGDTISASMSLTINGVEKQGVALFEFNRKSKKISALRCYFDL